MSTPTGTVYSSSYRGIRHRFIASPRARRVAAVAAGALLIIGAGLVVAGLVSLFAMTSVGLLRSTMLLGLGLVGTGAGTLLRMGLQATSR